MQELIFMKKMYEHLFLLSPSTFDMWKNGSLYFFVSGWTCFQMFYCPFYSLFLCITSYSLPTLQGSFSYCFKEAKSPSSWCLNAARTVPGFRKIHSRLSFILHCFINRLIGVEWDPLDSGLSIHLSLALAHKRNAINTCLA